MRFFSDNAATVHPAVIDAMIAANRVDTAYDGDALSCSLDGAFSALFERDVKALWMPSGTVANCLALAQLCPPHGSILCHRDAHIQNDEGGAPEFYTHGAKLLLGEGEGAKLTPATAAAVLDAVANDVHRVQPHAISITNASEYGCVYTPAEVAALGDLAKARGLGFHMDGARFANAVAHLGCSPADLTWRAGVDMLSFGFVKNGGMSAEALIVFDPDKVGATLQRRKRGGHLLSKGRFLAAQILALVKDDLWIDIARAANAAAQVLGTAAGERLLHPVQANEVFARMTPAEAAILRAQRFDFYDWAEGEVRFVTSWDQDLGDVAAFAAAIAAL
jgi:threonine aldolase